MTPYYLLLMALPAVKKWVFIRPVVKVEPELQWSKVQSTEPKFAHLICSYTLVFLVNNKILTHDRQNY